MRPAGARPADGPRDLYDELDPARERALRRANRERLALLEVDGAARRARPGLAGADIAGLDGCH